MPTRTGLLQMWRLIQGRENMTAYLLVDHDIHDQTIFQEFRSKIPALIAKHCGEFIVRGGAFEVIEGDLMPHFLVILRFPDRQAIQKFLSDPEYLTISATRSCAAKTVSIAVDGIS